MNQQRNGMMIVYGNQTELLIQVLIGWLKQNPLSNPLQEEIILTQSNGVKQWLQQQFADVTDGLGIAAGLSVQLPANFLWQMYRAVLGEQQVSRQCLLDAKPMALRLWRLLQNKLAKQIDNAELAPLLRYWNKAQHNPLQQLHLCNNIADIFDQYQVYRSDWLDNWQQGKYFITNSAGQPLALELSQYWQAWLWQQLLQDAQDSLQVEQISVARSQIHQLFIKHLTQGKIANKHLLPKRVIIFGLSSLAAQSLQALDALSNYCQVLFFVNNPTPYYWGDIQSVKQQIKQRFKSNHKLASTEASVWGHPLLSSWGKQGKDFINLLAEYDNYSSYQQQFPKQAQIYQDIIVTHTNASLLQQIQQDIYQLNSLTDIVQQQRSIDPQQDKSIQFFSCYSAKREVEVLHNQLLDLLANDRQLQPKDILVMAPNIDDYAPFIKAVFANYTNNDKRYIAYSLSDQALNLQAPILQVFNQLLQLPESRFNYSEVISLLELPALQQRFSISSADLPALQQCLSTAQINWALDAQHKQQLGLPANEQNSWLFGVQRILLSLAVNGQQTNSSWQQIVPLANISAISDSSLAGLIALIDKLGYYRQQFLQPHTALQWNVILRDLLNDFLQPLDDEQQQLVLQLEKNFEHWLEQCQISGLCDEPVMQLPFALVREFCLSGLEQQQHGAFLNGGVTFANLLPMRALPFKVIYLLGMNDGSYPRSNKPLSFDLMAKNYRLGDRSKRDDDVYLLLETIMSARQALYVSWIGRSIQDNSEITPSLLISQLREHISQGWNSNQTEQDLIEQLTYVHPMQAFSGFYYQAQNQAKYPTYAKEWQQLYTKLKPQAKYLPKDSLPLIDWHTSGTSLEIDFEQDVLHFVRHPVRYFFNKRLEVFFTSANQPDYDIEPMLIDGLERWKLLDYLLKQQVVLIEQNFTKVSVEEIATRLQASFRQYQLTGKLPVGIVTQAMQEELLNTALQQLLSYQLVVSQDWHKQANVMKQLTVEFIKPNQQKQKINLQLNLTNLWQNELTLVQLSLNPSKFKDKTNKLRLDKILPYWLQHLATQAVVDQPLMTKVVYQDGICCIGEISVAFAKQQLLAWVELWYQAHNYPVPLVQASFSYVQSLAKDKDPVKALRTAEKDFAQPNFVTKQSELSRDLTLQAVFADFAELSQANFVLPQHSFVNLANELIYPIIAHISQEDKV